MLEGIRAEAEKNGDAEPKVYSYMSKVFALYYNRKEDHENYYKSCLSYLAYTPADEIPPKEQKELSIKMSMSILLGKNVFNIAELLDKEVVNSLVGSEFEWLYQLIKSLGEGNILTFEKVFKDARGNIQKFPNIIKEEDYLKQKVRILALLELIFSLDKDERSISFSTISQHCHIPADQVEYILLKSMSLVLVKGTIDEVDQVVHINWVLPRYLSK